MNGFVEWFRRLATFAYFLQIPSSIHLFVIMTNTNLLDLSDICCIDFERVFLQTSSRLEIGRQKRLLVTLFLSNESDLFFNSISSVLPFKPYNWMNTFASVPAPALSPVKTVISYGIVWSKIHRINHRHGRGFSHRTHHAFWSLPMVLIRDRSYDHPPSCPTSDGKRT